MDSDYYGFLIEHGVCSNDIWRVDHELDYDILYTDYPDLYDFLPSGKTTARAKEELEIKSTLVEAYVDHAEVLPSPWYVTQLDITAKLT